MPESTPLSHDYQVKHLSRLVGKKVKRLVADPESRANGLGDIYGLEFTDGTTAWIMRDPEGNGPGHLDIVEGEKTKAES